MLEHFLKEFTLWILLSLATFFSFFSAVPVLRASDFETRCGWIDNPTPANWDLTDRHGTWLIGAQGGYQAKGDVPQIPESKKYWVNTNIHYGYGCACLKVKTDPKQKRILEIKGGQALPLARCYSDKTLPPRAKETATSEK